MINAGDLNRRITLQSPTVTTNDAGEETNTYADAKVVFASIKPIGSAEKPSNTGTSSNTATHLVTIRYRAGILTSYRVKYGTRIFDIDGIRNIDEGNHTLEISVIEHRGT